MSEADPQHWRIEGPLTVAEVPDQHAASLARRRRGGMPSVIDLSDVEATDSSALALLLEWLSWARADGRELAFESPPEGLRVIAGLSDTAELLGWPDEEPEEKGA